MPIQRIEKKLAEAQAAAIIAAAKLRADGQLDDDIQNAIVASSELVGLAIEHFNEQSRYDRYLQMAIHGLLLKTESFNVNHTDQLIAHADVIASKAVIKADKYMEEISKG